MGDLRDELIKKGLVTEQRAKELENQKRQSEKVKQRKPVSQENNRLKDWFLTACMVGELADQMINQSHRTYKELICQCCGVSGSTPLDVVAAHSEMAKECGFKFMIDPEENEKFLKDFKEKVGIIIDTYECEGKKIFLCRPCRSLIV